MLKKCTCGVDKNGEWSKGQFVAGAVSAVIVIPFSLSYGLFTKYRIMLILGGLLTIWIVYSWFSAYRSFIRVGHKRECARRYAWIESLRVGPMY